MKKSPGPPGLGPEQIREIRGDGFTRWFNTLAEPDVRTYIDWAVEFILAEFGRLNIGAALLRRLGQQLDEQAPNLPRRGKTPGTERSFTDMLGYRIINILSEKGKVPASLLPDYYYQ